MTAGRIKLLTGLLLAGLCLGGCGRSCPPVRLEAADVEKRVDYSDLAFVLDKAVDRDGYVIAAQLAEVIDRLDDQLRQLAAVGPSATPELLPGRADRLAYWYNLRTAWSLKLTTIDGCGDLYDSYRFLRMPADGRLMTARNVDEAILELAGWQAVVAAPGAALQRAQLPNEPFSPATVEQAVPRRFNEFMDSPDRVVIDTLDREVEIPPVLWYFRERIIRQYEQQYGAQDVRFLTALLPHLEGSALRRMQDAVGFDAVKAPWTLQTTRRME